MLWSNRVCQRESQYSLTMVGADEDIECGHGIVSYPFMDDNFEKLNQLYDEAAVLVMPSYKENLGLVYLEAMAHKIPVVVTSRGGFAEIIRRTGGGEVVRPGNIDDICDAIRTIIKMQDGMWQLIE